MARTISRFGCTAIERNDTDTVVVHMGARGHTETAEVKTGVDAMLGRGAFARIRPFAIWERDGDGRAHQQPDMIYAFRLSNEMFDTLMARSTAPRPLVRA